MVTLVFDAEADGFLAEATKVHCLSVVDANTRKLKRYVGHEEVEEGLRVLAAADVVVGHNIIGYDLPLFAKVFGFELPPTVKVRDTMICSQLIWPEIKQNDFAFRKKNNMPSQLIGKHSLEAWGYRVGDYKGDFDGPWDTYTDTMGDYCDQDTLVCLKVWDKVVSKQYSEQALDLEHDVAYIVAEQIRTGVRIDRAGLERLIADLSVKRAALHEELRSLFHPWYKQDGKVFVPKKDHKSLGYTGGAPLCKVKLVVFNPASREQIADRLIKLHGWEPPEYTDNGNPVVDEETLSGLSFPGAPKLLEYLTLQKRLGQMAEGKQAWLNHITKAGRIHGGVTQNGAVTGRATHQYPNLGQVPKVGTLYGEECRRLFLLDLGVDLSGIELRGLAHFMAPYDGGAYVKTVVEGKQSDGTDVHSVNCRALGLDPKKVYTINGKPAKGRDIAKTFIYAFLYGAGDAKLGSIIGKGSAAGRKLRAAFLENLPALDKLLKAIKKKAKVSKHLKGLDGRILNVRSAHSAPNTLLQSFGALVAKKAMVNAYIGMKAARLDSVVKQVLWVHDEFDYDVLDKSVETAKRAGEIVVAGMRKVQHDFNLRVPIDGDVKTGGSWYDVH